MCALVRHSIRVNITLWEIYSAAAIMLALLAELARAERDTLCERILSGLRKRSGRG